jgi:hypothetical protein
MATIRVEKNRNYTVMSNTHLRDKNLSLKAKGLLSMALSLPDNWEYSLNGLVAICKESETAVRSTIKELKEKGYLTINRSRNQAGIFEYEYVFYENPHMENPHMENPHMENPHMENVTQLNTNILNTKELNTNILNTDNDIYIANKQNVEAKHKYGEYKHVMLKDSEYEKLADEYGEPMREECITFLDEYIEMKGYKAKNHYLCIRKWVANAVKEKQKKQGSSFGNTQSRLSWIDNITM